jgi:LysM repeat protein
VLVRAGIIAAMTDRGAPTADGSPACPFVAFEDDRDERADRPDHRHRCFAEAEPAPRALAHQEAYCLSSAFPVCPIFQEWAHREAAHAVSRAAASDDAGEAAAAVAGAAAVSAADDDDGGDLWGRPPDEPPLEERPTRNPPRDWAAPPPWASGAGAGAAAAVRDVPGDPPPSRPPAPPSQGLAGSAADRLAQGDEIADVWRRPSSAPRSSMPDSPAAPADPELAGLVGGAAAGAAAGSAAAARASSNPVPPSRPVKRPTVSSTRSKTREPDGPSWEEQRRHEAYPSIKARAGVSSLPNVPTVAIVAGGVLVAAIALFFLPALLGVGGPDTPTGASPTPSAAASTAAPTPTPVPEPTAQVYVIKAGDTLSAIAREFNVSLDALLAANKDTISNPNRIKVGDEIIIPLPETTEPPAEPSEASAAPSAT